MLPDGLMGLAGDSRFDPIALSGCWTHIGRDRSALFRLKFMSERLIAAAKADRAPIAQRKSCLLRF
jgi:hypothetical protein